MVALHQMGRRGLLPLALAGVVLGGVVADAFDVDAEAQVQRELDEWSRAHSGHGIQFMFGNSKENEIKVFSAGYQDSRGTLLSNRSIFRMASMTKIMAAAVAAIAFEEGVVRPEDPVSQYLPDFNITRYPGRWQAVTFSNPANLTSATLAPLQREITLWDLLGMKGGFTYAFFGYGTLGGIGNQPPNRDAVVPLSTAMCGNITTSGGGRLQTQAEWLECMIAGNNGQSVPLISQPGTQSVYGYDYDVLGMALGQAYNMDPATLMKEKLWDPLGMESAMMSHTNSTDPRLANVVEISAKPLPRLRAMLSNQQDYPPASSPDGLPGLGSVSNPSSSYIWYSQVPQSTMDWFSANNWQNFVSTFPVDTSGGTFSGMSGYGEGSMMTFSDYGRFLAMLTRQGVGLNGQRVMGPLTWQWFMQPTVGPRCATSTGESCATSNGASSGYANSSDVSSGTSNWQCLCQPEGCEFLYGLTENRDGTWKWGYTSDAGLFVSTPVGGPTYGYWPSSAQRMGSWGGYFGTQYWFDANTGYFMAGGENTVTSLTGLAAEGLDFIKSNAKRWAALLSRTAYNQNRGFIGSTSTGARIRMVNESVNSLASIVAQQQSAISNANHASQISLLQAQVSALQSQVTQLTTAQGSSSTGSASNGSDADEAAQTLDAQMALAIAVVSLLQGLILGYFVFGIRKQLRSNNNAGSNPPVDFANPAFGATTDVEA